MINIGKLTLMSMSVLTLLAATPSSTNYQLKSYDFGTGGGASTSTNYGLDSLTGGQSGGSLNSTNYTVQSGELPTQHANVPPAPTFVNPSNEYNRLHLTLDNGDNPTDTKFLIAISSDNFVTTKYVQSDNSIGASLVFTNYQTYSAWGGGSGFWVTGLEPSTTYEVKVSAWQGKFSGSAFGPISSAATVGPTLSFLVETVSDTVPPYNVSFGSLFPGTVTTAIDDISATITSNTNNGSEIYIKSANVALVSVTTPGSIASATADLGAVASGYGVRSQAVSQVSGGPLTAELAFDLTGNNVAALSSSYQKIATSASPIVDGNMLLRLMAKAEILTPAATDYGDTLTIVASPNF